MRKDYRWLGILIFGFFMSMSAAFLGGEVVSGGAQVGVAELEAESFDEELAHAAPADGVNLGGATFRWR